MKCQRNIYPARAIGGKWWGLIAMGMACHFLLIPPDRVSAANTLERPFLKGDTSTATSIKHVDPTAALSLNDCVFLALENSLDLGALQCDMQIAEFEKKDTDNIYWPRIQGGVDFIVDDGEMNDNDDRNHIRPFLSMTQSGLNDGKNIDKLRKATTELADAKIDLLQGKRRIVTSVVDSYFAVYLNQKQIELKEKVLVNEQRKLHDLRFKYQGGWVAEIEALKAETALSSIELEIQRDKNALAHSIMALALVLGLPAERPLTIAEIESGEILDISWEQCRDIALENNAELKIYEDAAKEMKRLYQTAKWTRWPSLSAQAYVGENPPQGLSPDANFGATLSLSQKIFDAGETDRLISRTAIEVKQYDLLVRYYRRTFINGLRLLYNQFVNSREELSLATQKHQLSKKFYDLTERSFEMGSISLDEKRKAEETIRHSEIMHSRAEVNYLASKIKLKIEMRTYPPQDQQLAPNADRVGDNHPKAVK
jgi:outer membrane protein TolC